MSFTHLKSYLDSLIPSGKAPGIDCVVCREHREILRYHTGYRDPEKKIPLTGNEQYYIFSMTKVMTVVCALQLWEQGKFALEDPVGKYIPAFADMTVRAEAGEQADANAIASGRDIAFAGSGPACRKAKTPLTVGHLFTMQGGFSYDLNAAPIRNAIRSGRTDTLSVASSLAECVLDFDPGTRFQYSLCHDLLGALIGVWSGEKFSVYFREHIAKPLGMKRTFFGDSVTELNDPDMAPLYTAVPGKMPVRVPLVNRYILTPDYESGGAGLVSNPADYALLADALANGGLAGNGARILRPETVEMMGTNRLTGQSAADFDGVVRGYGYGLGVRTHHIPGNGIPTPVGEFGWDGAAGSYVLIDPKNRLSMTLFRHIHAWDLNIRTEAAEALYADLPDCGN